MKIREDIINNLVQEEMSQSNDASDKYHKNRCDAFREVGKAYATNTAKLISCKKIRLAESAGHYLTERRLALLS